jgi:hypothetical protein
MSDRFPEQRINIKFCVKLRKKVTDTYKMLSEAYRGEAMKQSGVFEGHKRFKEGRDNVENDERSGRPRSQRTNESVGKV